MELIKYSIFDQTRNTTLTGDEPDEEQMTLGTDEQQLPPAEEALQQEQEQEQEQQASLPEVAALQQEQKPQRRQRQRKKVTTQQQQLQQQRNRAHSDVDTDSSSCEAAGAGSTTMRVSYAQRNLSEQVVYEQYNDDEADDYDDDEEDDDEDDDDDEDEEEELEQEVEGDGDEDELEQEEDYDSYEPLSVQPRPKQKQKQRTPSGARRSAASGALGALPSALPADSGSLRQKRKTKTRQFSQRSSSYAVDAGRGGEADAEGDADALDKRRCISKGQMRGKYADDTVI